MSIDKPITSIADVLATLPVQYRRATTAPIRDAVLAGLTAICLEWQRRSQNAADMCDIAHALEKYLEGLADDRGSHKAETETDTALRARAISLPLLVTRTAILAVANSILTGHTAIEPRCFESILDRAFLFSGGAATDARSFFGTTPLYLDRLYPDDVAQNSGYVREHSNPPGLWLFGDHVGRYFVLVVPEFTPTGTTTLLDIYQSIVDAVELVLGQGIRWMLISDPSLT